MIEPATRLQTWVSYEYHALVAVIAAATVGIAARCRPRDVSKLRRSDQTVSGTGRFGPPDNEIRQEVATPAVREVMVGANHLFDDGVARIGINKGRQSGYELFAQIIIFPSRRYHSLAFSAGEIHTHIAVQITHQREGTRVTPVTISKTPKGREPILYPQRQTAFDAFPPFLGHQLA
jgi:hypothetical protein